MEADHPGNHKRNQKLYQQYAELTGRERCKTANCKEPDQVMVRLLFIGENIIASWQVQRCVRRKDVCIS